MYLGSIFVPLAGFIIGAIFLTNPNSGHKRVGKICMILAVFSVPVYVVLLALSTHLMANA